MSPGRSTVGVVVLNYRGAEDTLRCVASLRASTHPVRVLVVDNASGDGSVERLRAEPDLELLESDRNLGFGGGCNLGARRLLDAGVDHLWLLNNDTTVAPDALAALVAGAEDRRVGAVGSVLYRSDEPDRVLTWGGGSLRSWGALTQDATGPDDRIDYLTAASLLVRAEAFAAVGGFDERYFFTWEDVDLCHRLRAAGWQLAVAPGARVWHRWGGTAAPLSELRIEEHVAGAVVFARATGRAPRARVLPLLLRYGFRAARHRDGGMWSAARRGWRSGWRRPERPEPGLPAR